MFARTLTTQGSPCVIVRAYSKTTAIIKTVVIFNFLTWVEDLRTNSRNANLAGSVHPLSVVECGGRRKMAPCARNTVLTSRRLNRRCWPPHPPIERRPSTALRSRDLSRVYACHDKFVFFFNNCWKKKGMLR